MGAIGEEELVEWKRMQQAAAAAANANAERILVSVRLRPLSDGEVARNEVSDWECINDNTIIFRNSLAERSMAPTAYTFDKVFRSDCSTEQVYEAAAKEVALSVVSGINASIFAYGQTSSGKTYTMNGITEYTVADIYDYIQRHEERAFVLKFSAIEIYNEAVRDLLSTDCTPLRIRDDPERGPIVEKLTEEILRDWGHMQGLLSICEAQRQVGETSLNEASSRSHQILRLTIESSAREFLGKDNSSTLSACVNFVDLAGSERASQALSAGARLKEGCHINRSLLTLGTIVRKLSKGRNGHIPYRDSKLTRILQPSLGGNARTAIICTMCPAQSHVEQSRNTLLFATCAKEVVTSARVNVVMSDKALVKHLQKELARLESALRGPGPTSVTSHSEALLREKDAKIRKMEKEIKGLIQQRDQSQSRLEVLLRFVGEDQASRLWAQFSNLPASPALNAREDEVSMSESSAIADQDFGVKNFNTSQYSEDYDGTDYKPYAQLSEIPEDQGRSSDTSPRFSVSSSRFNGQGLKHYGGNISYDTDDDADICKEVRCIEMEESVASRNGGSSSLLTQGNGRLLPWTENGNAHSTDEELVSTAEGPRELRLVDAAIRYDVLEQQVQGQRTMGNLVTSYRDGSPSWPIPVDFSSSRSFHLTKSRSCRASLMTSSSSAWFQDAAQDECTPPSSFDKDFPRKYDGFQRRPSALKYRVETETLSREDSQNSECSSATDILNVKNSKTAADENITSIHSFVAELKEMTKLQQQKQLINGQEAQLKSNEGFTTERTSRDVGLDPMQYPSESPSRWPLEFQRQQREIIELWHTCNVSLVHRTYFFLLFKGDPADSIYMEVELRRLSFLRNLWSRRDGKPVMENGRVVTAVSSMKALRREREILSKKMKKSFSKVERDTLYCKWGIGLRTRHRRLQLANRLWTETREINHIKESAAIVAKIIGFSQQPGQTTKEMFGLSFTPQQTSRRSYTCTSVPAVL